MESGCVISYIEEKQYGFIDGDDNRKYFFHKNDILDKTVVIRDGMQLEFDPIATAKGYAAKEIKVLASQKTRSTIDTYVTPEEVYISKTNSVKGWEVVETSDWKVIGTSKDLDTAKSDVLYYAEKIGGNALLNYRYTTSKESEGTSGGGTYHYTMHSFSGDVVTIAQKSSRGEIKKEDFFAHNINDIATELALDGIKKMKNRLASAVIFTILFAVVFTYSYFYDVPSFDMNFFEHMLESPLESDDRKLFIPVAGFLLFTYVYWKLFFKIPNEWLEYNK